jgi:hypothetical protein
MDITDIRSYIMYITSYKCLAKDFFEGSQPKNTSDLCSDIKKIMKNPNLNQKLRIFYRDVSWSLTSIGSSMLASSLMMIIINSISSLLTQKNTVTPHIVVFGMIALFILVGSFGTLFNTFMLSKAKIKANQEKKLFDMFAINLINNKQLRDYLNQHQDSNVTTCIEELLKIEPTLPAVCVFDPTGNIRPNMKNVTSAIVEYAQKK